MKIQWLLLLLFACDSFAQSVSVQPAFACAGDSLSVTYRVNQPKAILSGSVPLYTQFTIYTRHAGVRSYTRRLLGDSVLHASLLLPADAASLTIRFYSLNKDNQQAMQRLYVYEQNRKTPVAGAFYQDFFTAEPKTVFEKELGYHPTNYLVYGKYFNAVYGVKPPEEGKHIIDSLLPGLVTACKHQQLPDAGLLAAICIGYAKTGRLKEALDYLSELFRRYPAAGETAFAFSLYNYEHYKATGKQVEDTVKQQLAAIYKKWPASALAADLNVSWYLHNDTTITVADFERVLIPLYGRETIPYDGLSLLPRIYIDRRVQLDSAEAMLLRVLAYHQDGSNNHQYRRNGKNVEIPLLLQLLSKLYLSQRKYQQSIVCASACLDQIRGTTLEGNFCTELLQLRANAYKALGNCNFVMDDYTALYKAGKTEWLDSMRIIYPYCSKGGKNWNDFVKALKNKSNNNNNNKLPAPELSGTDLAGNKVRFSALKGKVIVLNFWATTCGPCVAEMPKLNSLVEKYSSNDKVIFLAITGDETERLLQFFKNRKFNYTIVNHAVGSNERYEVSALPAHFVIDKTGDIISKCIGAREDIATYLEQQIEVALH